VARELEGGLQLRARRAGEGLKAFAASRSGQRAGCKIGFPRPRKPRSRQESCRFTTGGIRVLDSGNHVHLPRLREIRTHENTSKLLRLLADGRARILSATISCVADRWYVAFGCEVDRDCGRRARPENAIGVDLGITNLAVLSTGEIIPNPRHLQQSLRRLRRASRHLSRGTLGSRRREKVRRQVGRIHARVRHQRSDGLHKFTTALAKKYDTVVVEHLRLVGISRNRRLARALADTGMAKIRRQLSYKTRWYGSRLVTADPFFPSSKTCSLCGWVKAKLSLGERTFLCERCGLNLDRDHNAALNLARLVEPVTGSAPETLTARGGERKTEASASAAACEAGTERPAAVGISLGAHRPDRWSRSSGDTNPHRVRTVKSIRAPVDHSGHPAGDG
jgi:putative transposase